MQRTKTPQGLQAQAEEQANQDHSRRLAELQALAPLLARLDAFAPALAQAGLKLYPRSITLYTSTVGGRRSVKQLRIDTGGLFDSAAPQRWLDALVAAGFREVQRDGLDFGGSALLKHGHLLVRVDLPRNKRNAAESAVRYAATLVNGTLPQAVPA